MDRLSPLTRIAMVLEQLPYFLADYALSLFGVVLTDTILFSLLLGCIALGLLTNALVAVATFFLIYVVVRTINSVANAIGMTGQAFTRLLTPPFAERSRTETPPS